MSFAKFKDLIELGDTVILYLSVNSMHAIQVQPRIRNKRNEWVENVFQTTYGALKVFSLVGKKYGTKVALSRGWAYVLHPTPELWTLTLPHRTQIIYTPDISLIIFQLELKPGSVVVEAGTGSGSLSHALIRSIKPLGHLHTFDFHEHRVSVVRGEFESHGIGQYVTVRQRDVCQDGFGAEVNGKADAVFLDLPHPWEAVPHAASAIKNSGGRFVSFSPCIEQVQRTCEALSQHGFVELATTECLQRELLVQTRNLPMLQFDFLYKDKEKPEMRSLFDERERKLRLQLDKKTGETPAEDSAASTSDNQQQQQVRTKPPRDKDLTRFITGMHPQTMTGHTGYLTAATLPPLWARPPRPAPEPAPTQGPSKTASET